MDIQPMYGCMYVGSGEGYYYAPFPFVDFMSSSRLVWGHMSSP